MWNKNECILNGWYYSVGDGEMIPVPKEWLSNNGMVIQLPEPTVEDAGKTYFIFAEVVPTTRRFIVKGYESPENDPQAFVFRLVGKAGTATANIDLTFFIFDTGYIDIERLPYGEYTLTTLHWAWRLGHPDHVIFNKGNKEDMDAVENIEDVEDAIIQATPYGVATLVLDDVGDVIIWYETETIDKWLTDDASGILPIPTKPVQPEQPAQPEQPEQPEEPEQSE